MDENMKDPNVFRSKKRKNIKTSLKKKLILNYVLIALVPTLIVSMLSYIIFRGILVNKVSDLTTKVNVQTESNIDNFLYQIENATSLVFGNDKIIVFSPSDNSDAYEKQQNKNKAKGKEDAHFDHLFQPDRLYHGRKNTKKPAAMWVYSGSF